MPANSFFLSYATKDNDFAFKLAIDLKAKGIKVWVAELDIKRGKSLDSQIFDALSAADQLIVVLTKESITSDNVLEAIAYSDYNGKKILPILVESVEIPFRLRRVQHVDFTRNYYEGLSALLRVISYYPRNNIFLPEKRSDEWEKDDYYRHKNRDFFINSVNEEPTNDLKSTGERDELMATAFSPKKSLAGNNFLVQVFAHTYHQLEEVKKLAAQVDEDTELRMGTTLSSTVKKGSQLGFALQISGLVIQNPLQYEIWKGEIIHKQFEVELPASHLSKDLIATVIISLDSVPIGHLKFKIKIKIVTEQQVNVQRNSNMTTNFTRYKQAFISYATEDRKEVLKRVQSLNAIKMSFFQDLLTLEPGDQWEKLIYSYLDKSDVVLLFWSTAASQSNWVKKEILYAFKRMNKNPDALPEIIPVIIEGPPPPKPPPELSFLHFNDKFLYLIKSEPSKRVYKLIE